jgi:hypothetical protein
VKSAGAKQAAEKLRSRASKLGSGEQGLKALIQSVELIGPAEAVPLLQSPSARVFPQPVKPKSFIWRLFGTTEQLAEKCIFGHEIEQGLKPNSIKCAA